VGHRHAIAPQQTKPKAEGRIRGKVKVKVKIEGQVKIEVKGQVKIEVKGQVKGKIWSRARRATTVAPAGERARASSRWRS
jgi:hypothetical protein